MYITWVFPATKPTNVSITWALSTNTRYFRQHLPEHWPSSKLLLSTLPQHYLGIIQATLHTTVLSQLLSNYCLHYLGIIPATKQLPSALPWHWPSNKPTTVGFIWALSQQLSYYCQHYPGIIPATKLLLPALPGHCPSCRS
jgi:hypothetical protein